MWNQVYNPLGNAALSTVAAAIPVVTLLVLSLAAQRLRIPKYIGQVYRRGQGG